MGSRPHTCAFRRSGPTSTYVSHSPFFLMGDEAAAAAAAAAEEVEEAFVCFRRETREERREIKDNTHREREREVSNKKGECSFPIAITNRILLIVP